MADVKISELTASAALTGDELIPAVQVGVTVRTTPRGLQRVPVNNQTGTAYTLVASDGGKMVRCSNAAAIALTVPASGTMAVGDVVMVRQVGAGQVTASGATLNVPSGVTAKTRVQGSVMSLHCVAADTFDVSGDLA